MRRVLMVTPHFPPDSSAASHRVRLLAPHLPKAGWEPTIVTVDPSGYEGRLDRGLQALVPSSLEIVRAPVWPVKATRRLGIGDLGLRALTGLGRVCRQLLAGARFDALFITVYPVYPALLGPRLKRQFHVPFVLDYQDPWVGEWGRSVGGGADGSPDLKSRISRQLGVWLEPHVVADADALVAVSQRTLDGIVRRIPAAAEVPQRVVPIGYEPEDFVTLLRQPIAAPFDPADGDVHLCYVGTLLPTGVDTLRLLLRGLARARDLEAAGRRLRMHFFGTSNQSTADRDRVLPIAQECGVADVVTERPGRIDYMDALGVMTRATAILLLGNSEPHYTASKLYPALLARRPLLALYHSESSVVSILGTAAREPSVRVVTYESDRIASPKRIDIVARHLCAIARSPEYRAADVDLAWARKFSAAQLSATLAGLLDRVAA